MHPWLSRKSRRAALVLPIVVGALAVPPACHAAEDPEAESAKRDSWQRPDEVIEELGVKPGGVVADVGAGAGYFSLHLADRVGPWGRVYAEDIDSKRLNEISERARKRHLAQLELILGVPDNPKLPAEALDAILVVDAFHEMDDYDAMLKGMLLALKPGGRLGIIDRKADPGQPRASYHQHHHIPAELVREDARRNGFHLLREEPGFKGPAPAMDYFFLIFEKPRPAANPR